MAVQVSPQSGFTAGAPVAVLAAGVVPSALRPGFVDASHDGREFLIARLVTDAAPRAPVNVLLNWTPGATRCSRTSSRRRSRQDHK
jgi:hypothetical protein